LASYIESGGGRLAITKVKDLQMLRDFNFTVLEKDRKYAILERK
jgi:hypothetical protein